MHSNVKKEKERKEEFDAKEDEQNEKTEMRGKENTAKMLRAVKLFF